jgi:hypothetical protein
LKAAGISPVKGAGISLALVMMFAMAFAACDNGTSSGKGTPPVTPDGPTDMGAGPTAADWDAVADFLKSENPADDVIYIRTLMEVTPGPAVGQILETKIPNGKTLVITGEVEGVAPSSALSTLPDAPRLIIPNRAKLTVEKGGTLVLGGPKADVYAGIVDISGGGALHVKEGAIFSINMSSRVSVNGTNPDSRDYSDDYIALNLESRSILAILGTFVAKDDIIAKSSAERRLIDILTSTAPVAIGAVKVYDSLPLGKEESSMLGGALLSGKNEATEDSPVKVADTPLEVSTQLNALKFVTTNYLQRIIYSGSAALGDSDDALNIPLNTRVIVERNVTQNRSLTIKDRDGGPASGSKNFAGTLEIAPGASITLQPGVDDKAPVLDIDLTAGRLVVAKGATLTVAKGATLDISMTDAISPAPPAKEAVLYGTVEVAAGGTIELPDDYYTVDPTTCTINWGTDDDTGIGKIILKAGSTAEDNGTNYIAPLPAGAQDYSWAAADADSTVTLSGDTLTLNGKLSVTKAAGVTLDKKAIVESGSTLTVENGANGLTVATGNKLTVAAGASVAVKANSKLSLNGLTNATDKGAVTLAGLIEVEEDGTIVLPALTNGITDKINYEGTASAIRLYRNSKAFNGAASKYVGPSTDNTPDSPWEWNQYPNTKKPSQVDLKAGGEFAVTGELTSEGTTNTNTIYTTLTVNRNSTLTVPMGKTLTLANVNGSVGSLIVNDGGEIVLGGADTVLDLTALDSPALNNEVLVKISGTIQVKSGAQLTYPTRDNPHWQYLGNGKAKVENGGLLHFDTEKIVDLEALTPLFYFTTAGTAKEYVEFMANGMNIAGDITMKKDTKTGAPGNKIPQSHTWTIIRNADVGGQLVIDTGTNLSVGGELHLQNGGKLKFTADDSGTVSLLTLEGHQEYSGTLILGSNGDPGDKTEIRASKGADFRGADVTIEIDDVTDSDATAATATLKLPLDTQSKPLTKPGTSVAAANMQNAIIETGMAPNGTLQGVSTTITSRTLVKPTVAADTAAIPAVGGFGEGVTIAEGVLEVDLENGAYGPVTP